MTRTARFWRFLGTPFRAIVALNFRQVRSLFSIAMLCGIISLSVENWAYTYMAHHAVEDGEAYRPWLGLLIERTRYNSGLQAWFALIMGLVVFGAEYFRVKWGNREMTGGSHKAAAAAQEVADAAQDEADEIAADDVFDLTSDMEAN